VSHIGVFGNVDVGSALLRACFDTGVPVLWFSWGGWFTGFASGILQKNVTLRMRQHRAAAIGAPELASAFVTGKIWNARTLVRRRRPGDRFRPLRRVLAPASLRTARACS
jgi:CRISPR-associated protein Cas1